MAKKRELSAKEIKKIESIKDSQKLSKKEVQEVKRITREYNLLKKKERVTASEFKKQQQRRQEQEEKFTHTTDITKKSIYFDSMYELYAVLGSQRLVAKELNVHPSTVSRHLRGKSGRGGKRNKNLEKKIVKKEKVFKYVLPQANVLFYQYALLIRNRAENITMWVRTSISTRAEVEQERDLLIQRMILSRRETRINDRNDVLQERLVVIRSGI